MTVKSFKPTSFKADGDTGSFEAVFATLGVVDLDGDKIVPGAIGNQDVIISSYGHESWYGRLPVGKGKIFERGNEAIVSGQFFTDTLTGNETYKTVKNVAELQEWSFSLLDVKHTTAVEGDDQIRSLLSIKVNEVSPVLKGAGVNTRTLAVKSEDVMAESKNNEPTSKRFVDHVSEATQIVVDVTDRAKRIKSLRKAKGKSDLSPQSVEQVNNLKEVVSLALNALNELLIDYTAQATDLAENFEQGVTSAD